MAFNSGFQEGLIKSEIKFWLKINDIKMEIREFQNLIREIYFEKDCVNGSRERIFLWLIEEVGELAEEMRKSDKKTDSMEKEFADVLAWLSSLANFYDIDLEECVKKKYPGKCPGCLKKPCECRDS